MPENLQLPETVPPMLATRGEAFDSDKYLYEIKSDGTRAITLVEEGDYRQHNRKLTPMRERYPELDFLRELEPGVVVDGEIVVLKGGKPSFPLMLKREQSRDPRTAARLARTIPATYVVFDLLYRAYEPITSWTLDERREELQDVLSTIQNQSLVFSDGVTGTGIAFFEQACQQGLEGVMAKRRQSRYQPGRRTESWIKFKRSEVIYCAIIGYLPDGEDDFKSLLIATEDEGELRFVGRVGSGIDVSLRGRLNELLHGRRADQPIISCREKGIWLEPGLYCTVSYLERTEAGELRAPVFQELIEE